MSRFFYRKDMRASIPKRTGFAAANLRFFLLLFALIPVISVDRARSNEIIAGVSIPIPMGMKKATDRRVELSVPGFKGGQVAYEGDLHPNDIIEFYKTNMPPHGWEFYASLLTGGGLLVYVESHQSVLIMVGTNEEKTTLAIMWGQVEPAGKKENKRRREYDRPADP
ncbi:MAG: hypothetical protein QF619_12905 [Candidatus Binatia bacterium]|mgnify:CR=1 FL=1|nr:hypothetical protein [Candidatus Binatia bacterium]